ncbi:MAG TPA: putative N-acetylmannosamine-6-phosphate 2-epimerase [Verrucomicrobiae bacterium]|nr:putative N-acetylmannosamine-6-phosphate 2-epimerase [Verrucomicrobiae bacterium]HTZ55663.1 putative N-acetylmannosamine-6-phosphate 2-epimerase [Candidatus Acidoferrum sp.]
MKTLDRLHGGLIVSVQAWSGSPIDDPVVLAAMAAAAEANGAAGVRMQGVANLRAARARLHLPMIGLIKRDHPGFAPYITPTIAAAREVSACGVELVAFDATGRPRPDGSSAEAMVAEIHDAGALAMADCATAGDALAALAAGSDILATTLCGYTDGTRGMALPALALVRELAELDAFVVCEGGIHHPDQVAAAFEAGADAVVVGTAITNTDWLVGEFAARAAKGGRDPS